MAFSLTGNPFVRMQKEWGDGDISRLSFTRGTLPETAAVAVRAVLKPSNEKPVYPETRIYHDTQEGRLFKKKTRLYYITEKEKWVLVKKNGDTLTSTGSGLANDESLVESLGLETVNALLPLLTAESSVSEFKLSGEAGGFRVLILNTIFADTEKKRGREGPLYVEVKSDTGTEPGPQVEVIEALTRAGVSMAERDPLTAGLSALGMPLPGLPLADMFTIKKDDTLRQGMEKIVAQQTYRIWANTHGTLLDLDIEYLHDMRVATRRLRSALRFVKDYFDEHLCGHLRTELAWIAAELGRVRDLDVFMETLDSVAPGLTVPAESAESLRDAVKSMRETDLRLARSAVKSKRFNEFMDRLCSFSRYTIYTAADDNQSLEDAARRILRRELKKTAAAYSRTEKNLTEKNMHNLRICFKRLRYYTEFFTPVLGKQLKQTVKRIVRFQDSLGQHQDAVVAMERLKALYLSIPVKAGRPDPGLCITALNEYFREQADVKKDEFIIMRPEYASISELLFQTVENKIMIPAVEDIPKNIINTSETEEAEEAEENENNT